MDGIVSPGDRLGSIEQYRGGVGTFTRNIHVFSSVLGKKDEVVTL